VTTAAAGRLPPVQARHWVPPLLLPGRLVLLLLLLLLLVLVLVLVLALLLLLLLQAPPQAAR
jgi:hypothetical protein